MPRFFVPDLDGDLVSVNGEDAVHIARTLRMRQGESVTLSDGHGTDAEGHIETVSASCVTVGLDRIFENRTESRLQVTVYAGFPKSDGASVITQKAVELGAYEIVFFLSERTVRRPSDAALAIARLNRIAKEAASQSERGRIPQVRGLLGFDEMLKEASAKEIGLFFYENGGSPPRHAFSKVKDCAVITGPEGGFSEDEAKRAAEAGLIVSTLGPRILRCETAPIGALAAIMYDAGEMDAPGRNNIE